MGCHQGRSHKEWLFVQSYEGGKRKKMRREEDQASKVFNGYIRKILLPSTTLTSQVKRPTSDISPDQQIEISSMHKIFSKDEVDEATIRVFYGNKIPSNAVKFPLWVDMVRAFKEAPRGYELPRRKQK